LKLDLEKASLLAATLLLTLAVLTASRGGGYGIAGLAWDSELLVTRSNLRIGPDTVLPGDRIRSVNNRPVSRDADLRGVLRQLDANEIWLEVERANHQVAVPLTPEAIEQNQLPAVLEGPYKVVRIDGMAVEGDMNLALMASWMRVREGRPSIFTVSVPDWSFEGSATRVRRPGPIIPLVLLGLSLAMVLLAHWRGRAEMMTRPREHWHLLSLALAAGGALLAFLSWHEGFMGDPVLLPFGLLALGLARPASLFFHQARLGRLQGPAATWFRLGAGLPAGIFAMAALYGWMRSLSAPVDGFVFDQLRVLVLVGVAASGLYHLADLGLQAVERRKGGEALRPATIWPATVAATLFIVSALVELSADPSGFLVGGYVPHLAGLIGVQWLGDMALLPRRAAAVELAPRDWEGPELVDLLVQARSHLGLPSPAFACRFDRGAVRLELDLDGPTESDGAPEGNGHGVRPRLRPAPVGERLAGLLELLDAEGGMIPRYKTVRGTDEPDDDPFEGLDRAVGVALVLPLAPHKSAPPAAARMRAYLIGPRNADGTAGVPDAEALEAWQQTFAAYPETWSRLQARAAEAVVGLLAHSVEEHEEHEVTVPGEPALTPANTALLYYAARDGERSYPVHEPDLVSERDLAELETFVRTQGPMLLTGPWGSGREFTARLVHARAGLPGPFIVLDCAEVPEALIVAELVGEADLPSRLDAASGGTLCLRDLSRLSLETQAEALAAVKAAGVRLALLELADDPVSSERLTEPLRRAVDQAILHRPALAERPDDIERAARFYLHRFAMRLGRLVTDFDEAALDWLREQDWPANYHSLQLCLLEAVVNALGEHLQLEDLAPDRDAAAARADDLSKVIESVERDAVVKALEKSDGNKSQAARLLGMKRTTYIRKLAKYAPDK
jgi:DNA-binding protein Fis